MSACDGDDVATWPGYAEARRVGLEVEPYEQARRRWPKEGRHILACVSKPGADGVDAGCIAVYQAFNPAYVRREALASAWGAVHHKIQLKCRCAAQHCSVRCEAWKVHWCTRLRATHDLDQNKLPVDELQVGSACCVCMRGALHSSMCPMCAGLDGARKETKSVRCASESSVTGSRVY